MTTQCKSEVMPFQTETGRELVAHFDGGNICSDGGGLLLQQTERVTGIIEKFAGCFTDHRDPDLIEHTVEELVSQRIYALALGYEDLNDHDELRNDPLLAVLVGKNDPTGKDRLRDRDKGKALAGKSTLNRLELTPVGANKNSRYKKITIDRHAVDEFFTAVFLDSYSQAPSEIVLDLDVPTRAYPDAGTHIIRALIPQDVPPVSGDLDSDLIVRAVVLVDNIVAPKDCYPAIAVVLTGIAANIIVLGG